MSKVTNCLICGVGGQGTVLASRLIAFASMKKGLSVRTAETIGMAQRGGSVVSHTRTGININSPMIPKGAADILIGFEPGEVARCLCYLKPDGTAVVNMTAVKPVTASLGASGYNPEKTMEYLKSKIGKLYFIDGNSICKECGSAKVLNIAMLTAAVLTGELDITPAELVDAVKERVNPKYAELNLKAIDIVCEKYSDLKCK